MKTKQPIVLEYYYYNMGDTMDFTINIRKIKLPTITNGLDNCTNISLLSIIGKNNRSLWRMGSKDVPKIKIHERITQHKSFSFFNIFITQ